MEPTSQSSASRSTVLATQRLRVTTWLPTDFEDLRELHADIDAMRYMHSGPEDEGQVSRRLAAYLAEQAQPGWTKWRVESIQREFLGRGGFQFTADRSHRELGYVLARHAWGHGLATELARALAQWHFAYPDNHVSTELVAYAFIENAASRRVLDKAGFSFVGESVDRGIPVATYRMSAAPSQAVYRPSDLGDA